MSLELSTNLLIELGGWPALKEARVLLERDKVREARREGDVIRARVQGAEKIYDAQITLADRISQVEVRCTCIESRRSGRVCAHSLAAGLALLQPSSPAQAPPVAVPVASSKSATPGPKRWLLEEAPPGTPAIEATVLLPLQLKDALGQSQLRVILEARRDDAASPLPWDPTLRDCAAGFAVSEEDLRILDAVENSTGAVAGINQIPRPHLSAFLRALNGHPRVWLGKKQRIGVRAATDRTKILLQRQPDGALELTVENGASASPATALPLEGWRFDGGILTQTASVPSGFLGGRRVIPAAQVPDFLTREWSRLEQTCEFLFPPGFEEFLLETDRPVLEARLEGALSGLTLDLVAHYGERAFSLGGRTEATISSSYHPDSQKPHRFWRRDLTLEKAAIAQAEAAGFRAVRGEGARFSLTHENQVARFLANALPRWRREWTVHFGPRLEATMAQIDIAEPEFSLRPASGEDWLSLDLKLSIDGRSIPLDPAEIQRWLQTGQSHARTPDKRVLLVPTEAWGEMREVLADCAIDQEPGHMKVARTYAPFLRGALTEQGFRAGENSGGALAPVPVQDRLDPQLWATLRPYQAQGVEWLAGLARQNFHGLLADDMGLGKTLQALAFRAWLRATSKEKSPALVVCPTSLVTNWLREAARFVPHLRTLDLTGPNRAERLARRNDCDLLVTSYSILRRDVEAYRSAEFALVILDEAQHIKNRSSQNAQAAKALRARHRLILTGTPLENSILDLWSLFDFLLPSYLGTATEFRERYETPLARGPEPATMRRLRQRVRPFFLRRTKEEVLPELPAKLEHLTFCELTNEQREVYRAVLDQGRREVFEHAGKAGKGRDRLAVLTTLLRLRQVCCHLDLLPQGDTQRVWKEPSAKLDRTFELIDEAVDGGHRVLLFSQFVRVLHLLRDEAQRRDLAYCYLDGQTTERQAEVDRFQGASNIPLFLISLKAGGTGLNLTAADTVIHFDPWWNPAVEEQATSRAHRLGQSRRVQAYKLIAAGTVEEKIQSLQARKRDLFQASVGSDEAFAESLTGDELEELLAG
jgi:superfamily II DNA or RNA helicase